MAGPFSSFADGFIRARGLRNQEARDKEEAAWRKEERDRVRKEYEQNDALDRALSGVPTTTDKWGAGYEGAAARNDVMKDDDGNYMPGVQRTPRSMRDVTADQAAAVRGIGGRRGAALAAQLQNYVDEQDDRVDARKARGVQLEASQLALSHAKVKDSIMQAGMLYSRGNLRGSMEALAKGYTSYPDGQQVVFTPDNKFGVATPDGKWVHQPVAMTPANVEAAINYAQRFVDPAAWKIFQDVQHGNRQLDIQSAHNDTLDRYYTGRLNIDNAELGLKRDEHDAKKRGGMYNRPPTSADIFSPIGLSDDGTKILGRLGGNVVEKPVPAGYKKLFPKVTGERQLPTKYLNQDDGTKTAIDANGDPMWNVLSGGKKAPAGVGNTEWGAAQKKAQKAGVKAALGEDEDGNPMLAYIGADGRPYSTIEEAAQAKAK